MTDDRPPIDWPHVLGDIAAEFGEPGVPLGTRGLAHVLRVSRGTVRNILDTGTEPAHTVEKRRGKESADRLRVTMKALWDAKTRSTPAG